MTPRVDLAEFLLARIAEDEATAQIDLKVRYTASNPARVLAECDAKRRIVERCQGVVSDFDREDTWDGWPDMGAKHLAEDVLQALAMPYADRSDYDKEWKP